MNHYFKDSTWYKMQLLWQWCLIRIVTELTCNYDRKWKPNLCTVLHKHKYGFLLKDTSPRICNVCYSFLLNDTGLVHFKPRQSYLEVQILKNKKAPPLNRCSSWITHTSIYWRKNWISALNINLRINSAVLVYITDFKVRKK